MIVAVVGISFAAFTYTQAGKQENTISTGTVTMTYNEPTNGIYIQNAIPMDDEQGKVLKDDKETFDFTVTATITGKTAIKYGIVAVKQTVENPIPDEYIRLYLEKNEVGITSEYAPVSDPKQFQSEDLDEYEAVGEKMLLDSGEFSNKDGNGAAKTFNEYYRLRMWVDKDYPLDGTSRTYSVKVNVYGKGQD